MKELKNYIGESILDNDKKIKELSEIEIQKEHIRDWMNNQVPHCIEDKDWYFDNSGHVHITGVCQSITFDDSIEKDELYRYFRIIEFEPSTRCECKIVNLKALNGIDGILPVSQIGRLGFTGFRLTYDTKENIEPKHFPMFVHGNIYIKTKGKLNLSIMPNCSGDLVIYPKYASDVKYPAGFPESVGLIKIYK